MSNTCANCGKGEEAESDLKTCTACKLVKYCSRDCQIAHRPQHKRECKKRAKELHDEKLFEQPPPLEDCHICFLQLPTLETGRMYMECCGKIICCGCTLAPVYDDKGNIVPDVFCPFCRSSPPISKEEMIERYEKRMDMNDEQAIRIMGFYFSRGEHGLPHDYAKALELWHRAGELGDAKSYQSIGCAYKIGRGVEKDEMKAMQYTKLAAMGGHVEARHNLGAYEARSGNYDRALKHWTIAVKGGCNDSLQKVKILYSRGHATKDDFAKALRSYQAYLDEIKSDQRDAAAAANDQYKYYEL